MKQNLKSSLKNNLMVSAFLVVVVVGIFINVVFQNSARSILIGHGLPKGVVFEFISHITLASSAVTIISIVFALLLAFYVSRIITIPVIKLSEGLKSVAEGDLDIRVEPQIGDEVGMAAEAFNQMVSRLKEITVSREQLVKEVAERKKVEAFLSQLIEGIDPLVIIGKDYRIIFLNQAYCRHVGKATKEIIGKFCYEVSHQRHGPCSEAGEACSLKNALETGKPCVAIHQHSNSDGTLAYVEVKTFPMPDEKGEIVSVIEILSDITERRHIEAELASRVEELEKFTSLFIDRELKMVELKEKINEFEKNQ